MDLHSLRRSAKERLKVDLVMKGAGVYRQELGAEIRFNIRT